MSWRNWTVEDTLGACGMILVVALLVFGAITAACDKRICLRTETATVMTLHYVGKTPIWAPTEIESCAEYAPEQAE